jgi:hypothetical protein
MFAQVFRGHTDDPSAVKAALDRWVDELSADADGWLGSTGGVTDDGTFVGIVRFASEEQARRNSDRPEQGRWFEETSRLFSGEITFEDSTDVAVDTPGDPNRAGFVQVMQGRTSDPAKAWELMNQDGEAWARFRPEMLASIQVNHPDNRYTLAIYFTSEAEAREGERKEIPEELRGSMEQMMALEVGEPSYADIREPWLHSPSR